MGKNQYLEPIDTMYKNYRFRSRLEAKWAVFFEKMGWKWVYEHQGYNLPSGPYLPDFYFPDIDVYAEVKPFEFSDLERKKCMELSELKTSSSNVFGIEVVLIVGQPELKSYDGISNGGHFDDVVFMPNETKYYPFYVGDSNPDKRSFTETYNCAAYAKMARFEFEWKQK